MFDWKELLQLKSLINEIFRWRTVAETKSQKNPEHFKDTGASIISECSVSYFSRGIWEKVM